MRRHYISLIIFSLAAHIDPLQASKTAEARLLQQLDRLLTLPHSEGAMTRSATLLATPQQIAALCDTPELHLAGKDARLAGRRTLIARCGARQHFLAIRIRVQGTWWMTRRPLQAGHIIQPADIVAQRGDIEGQPSSLMFDSGKILGQRLLRDIEAGKPLQPNLLRPQWLLRSGQTVEVITLGEGFRIRAQGKALNHAAAHDTLRVKMRNGQTLSGTVAEDGRVILPLAQ